MILSVMRLWLGAVIALCLVASGHAERSQVEQERPSRDDETATTLDLERIAIEVALEDVEAGTVRYVVDNRSGRIITAWCVAYRMSYAKGFSDEMLHATDWAMTGRTSYTPGEGPLQPGERREVTAQPVAVRPGVSGALPHGELTGIGVEFRAVVFNDLSAAGDPARAARILEDRKIQQFVREHWLKQLRALLADTASDDELPARLRLLKGQLSEGSSKYASTDYSSDHAFARMEEESLAGLLQIPTAKPDARTGGNLSRRLMQVIDDLDAMVRTCQPHVPR